MMAGFASGVGFGCVMLLPRRENETYGDPYFGSFVIVEGNVPPVMFSNLALRKCMLRTPASRLAFVTIGA
jgi:hypothetical protein